MRLATNAVSHKCVRRDISRREPVSILSWLKNDCTSTRFLSQIHGDAKAHILTYRKKTATFHLLQNQASCLTAATIVSQRAKVQNQHGLKDNTWGIKIGLWRTMAFCLVALKLRISHVVVGFTIVKDANHCLPQALTDLTD